MPPQVTFPDPVGNIAAQLWLAKIRAMARAWPGLHECDEPSASIRSKWAGNQLGECNEKIEESFHLYVILLGEGGGADDIYIQYMVCGKYDREKSWPIFNGTSKSIKTYPGVVFHSGGEVKITMREFRILGGRQLSRADSTSSCEKGWIICGVNER